MASSSVAETKAGPSSAPSAAAQEEMQPLQRKQRRLHADERAQLIYQKIQAERKANKEKRLVEQEKRQKALESYVSIKRKMNKALMKRNKRGQPNLNAQIEVLLEKIEKRTKKSDHSSMTDGKATAPRLNEFHYRCNHLFTAAGLLSSQSSGNKALEALSKLYLREMKELCLVEMVRLEKDFGRTICKQCKNIFVARSDGSQSINLRLNKRKQLVRTCLSCGTKKQFLRNSRYLSRNERDRQTAVEEVQQVIPADDQPA